MKTKQTGRDAIVIALANAYDAAANIGSKIGEVCGIARAAYKGAEIPDDDANYIADKLAESRGWEGAVAKVRKSEARKVLHVYSVLPEAIAKVREEKGGCNWRDALKLATCLKEHGLKLKPALAAFTAEPDPKKANYPGRIAALMKKWHKVAKGEKRAAIIAAANTLHISLALGE